MAKVDKLAGRYAVLTLIIWVLENSNRSPTFIVKPSHGAKLNTKEIDCLRVTLHVLSIRTWIHNLLFGGTFFFRPGPISIHVIHAFNTLHSIIARFFCLCVCLFLDSFHLVIYVSPTNCTSLISL